MAGPTLTGASVFAAVLVLVGPPAQAGPVILLGPPDYFEQAYVVPGDGCCIDASIAEGTIGGRKVGEFGTVTGIATTAARQRVTASGSIDESDGGQDFGFEGAASATLNYTFEIVFNDPSDPTGEPVLPVDIGIRAMGNAMSSGQG